MSVQKTDILLSLQRALLGEIYSNIRMIVFKHIPELKYFELRYYIDREPSDDDYESMGNVMAEFISDFKHTEFDEFNEQCIYSLEPNSQLDPMDGVVFCRKEI